MWAWNEPQMLSLRSVNGFANLHNRASNAPDLPHHLGGTSRHGHRQSRLRRPADPGASLEDKAPEIVDSVEEALTKALFGS
jgi:hypothetical protein